MSIHPPKTDPFRPLKLPRPLKLGHGELGNDLHLRNPKGRWFSKRGKLMGIRDANVGSLGEISAARMGLTWFNMVQLHRQPHVIIQKCKRITSEHSPKQGIMATERGSTLGGDAF